MMNNLKEKRKSGQRPKKYKFRGNQHTKVKQSEAKRVSASSKKLNGSSRVFPDAEFSGYCFIDKSIVFKIIEDSVCCKICGGNINIKCETVAGLSEKVNILCNCCGEIAFTRNSAMLGPSKNLAEINTRFIYAMRAIGQGLFGAKTFCGILDLPQPVTLNAYNSIVKNIKDASSKVAKESMTSAVELEIEKNGGVKDLIISGDGTWKTRGHTSLVGVCTVIGAMSGKVIDTEVLSSYCRGCTWKGTCSGSKYEAWRKEHAKNCDKNHSGSASMMEVVGMSRIFERSSVLYNVRYAQYIGDGDCKTFTAIEKSKPYGDNFMVSKLECVGHMQKRMGARLRKRKQDMKGKKLSDGKLLSGKGRLTDELINKLTIYYGNAIRKHSNSLQDMRFAIWAIFYHKRSTDAEPSHQFCPTGANSWCPYQKASMKGELKNFKHKSYVSPIVIDAIKDIFKDLSMPSLLKRCVGGYTQNSNESLNSVIWKFCPKTSGSSSKIVQIAVNEAVVIFNEGQKGRLNVMHNLGYKIGKNAESFASERDELRILSAEKKAEMSTIEARRAKKRAKIASEEAIAEKEGTVYAAGLF